MTIEPMLAANAAVFAIKNATTEGKITVIVLLLLSLFSWTIILTKFRQLLIARAATKKFLDAYSLDARSLGHPAQERGVRRCAGVSTLHPRRGRTGVSFEKQSGGSFRAPKPVASICRRARPTSNTDILARDRRQNQHRLI